MILFLHREVLYAFPGGGGGTPILDLTGCAAQQGVLLL